MVLQPRQLVVVESPVKARTLQRFLGPGYVVRATSGHVKDLPEGRLGIDPRTFEAEYRVLRGKGRVLQELGKEARLAERVLLATDPDREGEAIAWHVVEELGCEAKAHRLLVYEITPAGIERALSEIRPLDRARYDAQQARRLVDRLIGFRVSPLLSRTVKPGLSAGRVQSLALRLLVERERELRAFRQEEKKALRARFRTGRGEEFALSLRGPKLSAEEAQSRLARLGEGEVRLVENLRRPVFREPPPPFDTLRLQQEAFARLRFGVKKTMRLAQELFEGMELGPAGQVSLLTYVRTDSYRVSDSADRAARSWLKERYGEDSLGEGAAGACGVRAQDAHEAIRPVAVELEPETLRAHLPRDHARLYDLVHRRFVASRLKPARYERRQVAVEWAGERFAAAGLELLEKGFLRAWREQGLQAGEGGDFELAKLPALAEDEALEPAGVEAVDVEISPPSRHTEATLLGALEALGAGRPSTWASIVDGLLDRGYARREGGHLAPTELGEHVAERLLEAFPELVDPGFSAQLEDELDQVAEGTLDGRLLLRRIWGPLQQELEQARPKREEASTSELCPSCNAPMRLRWGSSGPFLSCTTYPKCRGTRELRDVAAEGRSALGLPAKANVTLAPDKRGECPRCGAALVERRGRGGAFLACTAYPACRTTLPLSTGVACPSCKEGRIAEKRSRYGRAFFGCDRYPACDFSLRERPVPTPCASCGAPFTVQRFSRKHGAVLACVQPDCGHARAALE